MVYMNHISSDLRAAALPWACAVETATAPAPRSLLPPAAMASAAASAAAAAAEEGEGREEARTRRTAQLPRPEAAMMARPAQLSGPGEGLSAAPSQPPAASSASRSAELGPGPGGRLDEQTVDAAAKWLLPPKMVANPKGPSARCRARGTGTSAPKGLPHILFGAPCVAASAPLRNELCFSVSKP